MEEYTYLNNKSKMSYLYTVCASGLLVAMLMISSCKKSTGESSNEAILNGCSDSFETKVVAQKIIGKWRLEASGCGYCPTANEIHIAIEKVKLQFLSDSNVIIFKEEVAIDTASFVLKKYSTSSYYLDQGQTKFNLYIAGGMFFCGDILGFDSRAGDGAIYLYHKLE